MGRLAHLVVGLAVLGLATRASAQLLIIGGGPTPDSNQVSIELDVALAMRTFRALPGAPPPVVLFADGTTTGRVVQVTSRDAPDPIRTSLAELYESYLPRDVSYRATELANVQGAASIDVITARLRAAVDATPDGPLVLVITGHGVETTDEEGPGGYVAWGSDVLSSSVLVDSLDRARPTNRVRAIVSTCFAAEYDAITRPHGARQSRALAAHDRCGFFASIATRPSSGCDPSASAASNDDYLTRFLRALSGTSMAQDDVDRDGHVSPLEAHIAATVLATSLDVPTSTSEEWLRATGVAAAARVSPDLERALPELVRLANELGARPSTDTLATTRARFDSLTRALEDAAAHRDGELAARLRSEIERVFPEANDPWRADWDTRFSAARGELERILTTTDTGRAWQHARAEFSRLDDARAEADYAISRVMRETRARLSIRLASALRARGGASWRQYERLLACERAPLFSR